MNSERVLKLNLLFNSTLIGLTYQDINLAIVSQITNQGGEDATIVRDILDVIGLALNSDEDFKIYTSGATNIFKYPELSESSTASEILSAFEEKKLLTTLVEKNAENDSQGTGTDIQVYIGNESNVQSMKDCSIVTASYEIEEGVRGTIGIIGPKRMDYEKVLETLNTVRRELDNKLKKEE